MEYIIVSAPEVDGLVEIVNGYIAQGWRPQGGVSAYGDDYLNQAMVRG